MKRRHFLCALLLLASGLCAVSASADEWQTLFNGKDLTGWRSAGTPESFAAVDGALKAHAPKGGAHLFFVGDEKEGIVRFKNFELEATIRSEPGSNSGIFFHTEMPKGGGRLLKGYEVQLNSSDKDKRKTGSLYAVLDLKESPVDETQWFKMRIRVQGKHIEVFVNDKQVIDYTEPDDVKRPPDRIGRVIDPNGGAIALQAHDPGSTFYFKDIRIKRLP